MYSRCMNYLHGNINRYLIDVPYTHLIHVQIYLMCGAHSGKKLVDE